MQDSTPRLLVRDGKVSVETKGPNPHASTYPDQRTLARFLAGIGPYEVDPSCLQARASRSWLDVGALAEAVEAEAEAYRAGDGWRIHGTGGDYTFWTRGDGYQVTKGEVPTGGSGYNQLKWLMDVKGVHAHAYVPAWGLDADVRAVPAGPVDGRPAWNGAFRQGTAWELVEDGSGPATYPSPDAARADARTCLTESMPLPAMGR